MKNDRFSQRKALPDRYFTMKEVSAIMQADEAQIKSWIEAERLHIVRFDNEPRISEAGLNEFIDQCRRSSEFRKVQLFMILNILQMAAYIPFKSYSVV